MSYRKADWEYPRAPEPYVTYPAIDVPVEAMIVEYPVSADLTVLSEWQIAHGRRPAYFRDEDAQRPEKHG